MYIWSKQNHAEFLRIGIVVFACFVMWFTPNSGIDFFRSLIILSMGYGYDYCSVRKSGMMKNDSYHVNLGTVGAVVSLIFFLIGLLSGGLIINLSESPVMITTSDSLMTDVSFPLKWLLYAINIFPILTGFEFFGKVREDGGG